MSALAFGLVHLASLAGELGLVDLDEFVSGFLHQHRVPVVFISGSRDRDQGTVVVRQHRQHVLEKLFLVHEGSLIDDDQVGRNTTRSCSNKRQRTTLDITGGEGEGDKG
jgi:hypothetical protein